MTKEEAIHEIEKVFEPAFANYIITALTEGATSSDKEQPPTLDTGQRERQIEMEYQHGYDKGWEDVLEKIRAEIEELKNAPPCFDDMFEYKYAVDDVLAIIDKYKSESEG